MQRDEGTVHTRAEGEPAPVPREAAEQARGEARRPVWPVIALAYGFLFLQIALTWQAPLSRDEGSYAVVAQNLLDGGRLYRDAVGLRPPLTYLTYAGGMALFGQTHGGVRMTGACAAALGLAGALVLAFQLGGRRLAPWVAVLGALFWRSLSIEGFNANTECFINLFAVVSAVFYVRHARRGRWADLFIAALIAGTANLFKQMAVANIAAMWLASFLLFPPRRDRFRGVLLTSLLLFAGAVLPWVVSGLWFLALGRWEDFWLCNFNWLGAYGAEGGSLGLLDRLKGSIRDWLPGQIGLWTLAAVGCAVAARKLPRALAAFLTAWLLATFAFIAYVGTFSGHHFQLALVPAVMLGALGAAALWRGFRGRPAAILADPVRVFVAVVMVLFVGAFAVKEARLCRMILRGAVQGPGRGLTYNDMRGLGLKVRSLTREGDRIFVWGREPEIYFYSGRRPACPVIWLDAWIAKADPSWMERQTGAIMEALRKRQPKVVVVTEYEDLLAASPLAGLLKRDYLPEPSMEGVSVFVRKPRAPSPQRSSR